MDQITKNGIADEYYDLIDKPIESKRDPQFCICMIGLIGAGKSTVLKKITQQIPLARSSGDEIRKMLYDMELPLDDAPEIGGIVARRLKSEGYCVAHDNDLVDPAMRARMAAINKSYDIQEIWIRIAPPESFIINKLKNYRHTYLFKNADDAINSYYRRKEMHKKEAEIIDQLPLVYTFDPSRPDLDQQVSEAVALIRRNVHLT